MVMTGIFHPDEQMILGIGFKLIHKKVEAQLIVFERNRFYDDLIVRSIQDAKHMRELTDIDSDEEHKNTPF